MAVDKNLFLYDLAVVTIMKNEAPYLKEWVDYHLLAGVNHFYLYDNQEDDEQKKILEPYISAGLVTHIPYPGKARQYEAYNDAVQNYRFFCRYMTFIDADEFVLPKDNRSIVEVVDEIFTANPDAAGLGVNIFTFGSNFQDKAAFSRGVLERFTRRASVDYTPDMRNGEKNAGGTSHISSITNPRRIDFFCNPHFAYYFEGCNAINEVGKRVELFYNYPPTVKKIVMHHYSAKSREEYMNKVKRGTADSLENVYKYEEETYTHDTPDNEVFDDSILKYRDARRKILNKVAGKGDFLEKVSKLNKIDFEKIYNLIIQNLVSNITKNMSRTFFQGKLETFLICMHLIEYMRDRIEPSTVTALEKISLKSIYLTMSNDMRLNEMDLLIAELPKILKFQHSEVKDIISAIVRTIPNMLDVYRIYDAYAWRKFVQLKYLTEMLNIINDLKK